MLQTGTLVLLEVGLDLALSLRPKRRLVHGEQDVFAVVRQHHRVEAAVHGTDVLRGELGKLVHTRKVGDVIHSLQQVVHVANRVVQSTQAVAQRLGTRGLNRDELVSREAKGPVRRDALTHEAHDHVTVQLHLGYSLCGRLGPVTRPVRSVSRAVCQRLSVRIPRVVHDYPDSLDRQPVLGDEFDHALAVVGTVRYVRPLLLHLLGGLVFVPAAVRCAEHKHEIVRSEHVGGVHRVARGHVALGDHLHTQRDREPRSGRDRIVAPERDGAVESFGQHWFMRKAGRSNE